MPRHHMTAEGPVPFTPEEEIEWDAMEAAAVAAKEARIAAEIRADRNARLAACDWTQLADAPADSLAWANYRQALRDIPAQPGFPQNIVWPVAP